MTIRQPLPYWEWEDYGSGMYGITVNQVQVRDALELLIFPDGLWDAMIRVTEEWPKASRANLSYLDVNPKAWLGWSSCYLEAGANYAETRCAWGLINPWEHDLANDVAESVIDEWKEAENGQQNLFR